MRLRYTAAALAHLEAIYDFLADRNQVAARRITADIRAAAERLRDFPYIGRKSAIADTHEWVVQGSPYLIVYSMNRMPRFACSRSSTGPKIGRSN